MSFLFGGGSSDNSQAQTSTNAAANAAALQANKEAYKRRTNYGMVTGSTNDTLAGDTKTNAADNSIGLLTYAIDNKQPNTLGG